MISADIVIPDTHVGHKLALCHPRGLGDYKMNAAQKWVWKCWDKNFRPDLQAYLDKWKPDYIHGLFGGDMGDIDFRNRSTQFWTKDVLRIQDNANELLEPLQTYAIRFMS